MLVESGSGLVGLLPGSGSHIMTSGRDDGKGKGAVTAEGEPIRPNHLHNQMSQSLYWCHRSPSAPFQADLPLRCDRVWALDAPSLCPL